MSDNRLRADGTQVLADLNWLLVREKCSRPVPRADGPAACKMESPA
jgi:hypothetical protein